MGTRIPTLGLLVQALNVALRFSPLVLQHSDGVSAQSEQSFKTVEAGGHCRRLRPKRARCHVQRCSPIVGQNRVLLWNANFSRTNFGRSSTTWSSQLSTTTAASQLPTTTETS